MRISFKKVPKNGWKKVEQALVCGGKSERIPGNPKVNYEGTLIALSIESLDNLILQSSFDRRPVKCNPFENQPQSDLANLGVNLEGDIGDLTPYMVHQNPVMQLQFHAIERFQARPSSYAVAGCEVKCKKVAEAGSNDVITHKANTCLACLEQFQKQMMLSLQWAGTLARLPGNILSVISRVHGGQPETIAHLYCLLITFQAFLVRG
ncbi:hypothetical protein J6590_076033 [Homalodisca vitripennis]|nr:hypothetical protein J6590_076033 [Homalodisca vitripennis]